LHHQIHQEQIETVRDGIVTQHKHSEVSCKDGLCQQNQVSLTEPVRPWMPTFGGMLRASRGKTIWVFSRPEMRDPVAPEPLAAPNAASQVDHPTVQSAQANSELQMFPTAMFAGCASLAAAGGAAAILAMLRSHRGSARESTLRSLGQPLSPAQQAVGESWQQWVDEAKQQERTMSTVATASPILPKDLGNQALKAYLSGMYVRAAEHAERKAARAYLMRLYEKASA